MLPEFSDIATKDITEQKIDSFVIEKQRENLSKVTLNMLLMLLKRLLQIAKIDTVKLGLEHPVRVKTSVKIMKGGEQQWLDKVVNSGRDPKYMGICLAFKLGLAIGEVCALEWQDIDFGKGTVQVKNTVQRIQNREEEGKRTLLVKMPLSASAQRELPISNGILQILKEYKQEQGYILKSREGKIPDPRTEQIRWEQLFKKQEKI